jgi:hypothetical protein
MSLNNKREKKNTTIGTIPNSNIKIVERGKIDTPNTHINDRPLSWLGTGTTIKSGGIKLVLWTQTNNTYLLLHHYSKMNLNQVPHIS